MTNPTESQVRRLDEMVRAERRKAFSALPETLPPSYDPMESVALSLLAEVDAARERVADEKYPKAIALVYATGKASPSYLQRKLDLGWGRAQKIIKQMQKDGLLGEQQVSGVRAGQCELLFDHTDPSGRRPNPTGAETPEVG